MTGALLAQIQAAQAAYDDFGALSGYDASKWGPLLGISDAGHFAQGVADALAASAKRTVFNDARANGLILDAERMGSAGEVPVGPPEYAAVGKAARGTAYFTTNVGVRANARYLQACPELPIAADDAAVSAAFAPFLKPAAGAPRPLTVLLNAAPQASLDALPEIGARIEALRTTALASAHLHRVGVLIVFSATPTANDLAWCEALIAKAASAGFSRVAFDGPLPDAARIRTSAPGLLQVFEAPAAARLLQAGKRHGIEVGSRWRLDVETAARTIWAGLHAARTHGLNAAKYGLTPMTLDEQCAVMRLVQTWMRGWSAIPAFYADCALVTAEDVFVSDRVVASAKLWLAAAAEAGADLVLFDCPDRFMPRIDVSRQERGRRLLKSDASDPDGAFTYDDVSALLQTARGLGVRILWSGGIQPAHALELARRGVDGVFSTSSTALPGPVTSTLAGDPRMATEGAPTRSGVQRMHALLQAGFLQSKLPAEAGARLEALLPAVLAATLESTELRSTLDALHAELLSAWQAYQGA